MKKLVRTSLVNTPNRRGIKDLNIQFYSHDKNNAGFEFVIKNETDLSEYTAKVLFHFVLSDSTWESAGTIEGNVVKATFNTDLIARCEEVLGFLFLDSESNSLDVFKFKFNVVLSEIDKNEVEKRKIKHVADIEALELVTRSELRDELAKIQVTGGVDLSGYLTTSAANETFATKQELGTYATKDELPSISGLVTTEQLTTAKNSVVEEINNKGYVTSTVAEETYAKKSDLPAPYNDSALVQKIGQLEARVDNDTVYDDTPLKERVTALESKAIEGGAYDDTHLRERLDTLEAKQDKDTVYDDAPLKQRVEALETKVDKDTVYNDEEVKRRLTELENKPAVDTSHFITDETLESKGFLTTHQDISNLATKEELAKAVTKEELEEKHYVTSEQISSTYATKSEIPQPLPYNDSPLVSRVSALENKQDKDTVYDDTKVKERLTALESKSTVDTSNFLTKSELNTLRPLPTLSINNNTLSIAGGNSVMLPTNQWEIHGTGMPNGVVEAEIGTTYIDKNKTNGALKWIKTTVGGNQGWEVLIGDTGWRTLNSTSKLKVGDRTSYIKIRRVNNLVTYQFGGLQWGWFGIIRRNGAGFLKHNSSGDKGAKVLGVSGIPEGFRSESSLIGGIYSDAGKPYGIWYLGGKSDSNFIQFTFNDPIPTDRDIGDIRVSAISYLTEEPWPLKLP